MTGTMESHFGDFMGDPTAAEFLKLVVAALLGLFIGLERERSKGTEHVPAEGEPRTFAGIRTFTLVCVSGFAAALLSSEIHPAVFVVGFALIGVFAGIAHFAGGTRRPGTTTEVAFILTYLLGGLVYHDQILLASMLALFLTALLATKPALHQFARSVSRQDIYSALKFGAISLVVLPLLPDRTYDPLEAVNPHQVWLLVVLISGMSFLGYILVKLFGAHAGIGLTGLLGGLVSSTATTLAFSRRSRGAATLSRGFAVGILLSCAVMYPRIFAIAGVLNRPLGLALIGPIGAITLLTFLVTLLVYQRIGRDAFSATAEPDYQNPVELLPAIRFAILFAAILVGVRLAQERFGASGLYVVSFVSGLAEMDAVTLTIARMHSQGTIDSSSAVAAIILASLANTIVKTAIVWMSGGSSLRKAAGIPLAGFALVSLLVLAALILRGDWLGAS
jgi:uncharacterized membrane protein (DUF4010 family)